MTRGNIHNNGQGSSLVDIFDEDLSAIMRLAYALESLDLIDKETYDKVVLADIVRNVNAIFEGIDDD